MKVSIIVAAYNEEQLLPKCLQSLLKQTLKENFEIIVVNDGSTDNTANICDEYASKYPSIIKVLHKENNGQGLARNDGIRISQGEYIGFVDADDWVDKDMFLEMYTHGKNNDSQIVVCDVHKIFEGQNKETKDHSLPKTANYVDIGYYIKDGKDNAYSCNKLFKRDIWEKYQFKKMVYEDLEVILTIISHCNKISYIQKPFYHYFKHTGSTTTSYTNSRLLDILIAYENAVENASSKFREEIVYCVAKRILINIETPGFKYYLADFIELINRLSNHFINNKLISNDKNICLIYTYFNSIILPKNLITTSNDKINSWLCNNRDINVINISDDSLFTIEPQIKRISTKDNKLNYLKIKKLYDHGGILINKHYTLSSPFGYLRSLKNFCLIKADGTISSDIIGFQHHHPLLLKMLNYIEKNEPQELDIVIAKTIEMEKAKKDSLIYDITFIPWEKIDEYILLSECK